MFDFVPGGIVPAIEELIGPSWLIRVGNVVAVVQFPIQHPLVTEGNPAGASFLWCSPPATVNPPGLVVTH